MTRPAACVTYIRVSTARQGASGLGLEAQREAVRRYVGDAKILGEFVEIESGRNAERPILAQALAAARVHRVPLIIAKVDRLTRSLAFLSRLIESGADVRFCDLPEIEGPTGRFLLQQMASVAELEAGMISARTKAALAAARGRGTKLGGRPQNLGNQEAGRYRSAMIRGQAAAARAADIAPILAAIDPHSIMALNATAAELNRRSIPAPRGGTWSAVQVMRLRQRNSKDVLTSRGQDVKTSRHQEQVL